MGYNQGQILTFMLVSFMELLSLWMGIHQDSGCSIRMLKFDALGGKALNIIVIIWLEIPQDGFFSAIYLPYKKRAVRKEYYLSDGRPPV